MDMLRAAVMDFGPTWHEHLAFMEFAYNNSYHRSDEIRSQEKVVAGFIGPFKIIENIGDVAYRLDFPPYLSGIHDVFHVSLLRQYVADESHILHPNEVKLEQDLSYVERPLRILDRKEKVLCNKHIPLVMVQWQRRGTDEVTLELESWMRAEHPELFSFLYSSL
ncbi:uncharacterized protein [Henckelia pumila]|uniref:uncharacterized protein n=1 Tax=Henckelia pumila TaxID=405737 RepID=UPI003C6DEE37